MIINRIPSKIIVLIKEIIVDEVGIVTGELRKRIMHHRNTDRAKVHHILDLHVSVNCWSLWIEVVHLLGNNVDGARQTTQIDGDFSVFFVFAIRVVDQWLIHLYAIVVVSTALVKA